MLMCWIVGLSGRENVLDTLFKVGNRCGSICISQTGQLSLEQSLQSFDGVFR